MALNRISLVFQWHLLSSWWMVTWKWQSVVTQEVERCNIVPCPSRNNNRNNLGTQNFPGLHWRTEDPSWLPKMNFRGKQAFTKIDPSQHILTWGRYLPMNTGPKSAQHRGTSRAQNTWKLCHKELHTQQSSRDVKKVQLELLGVP